MTKIAILAALMVLTGASAVQSQALRLNPASVQMVGQGCAMAADTDATRLKNLIKAGHEAREAAELNPLLLADVAYYEAEIAAANRCTEGAVAVLR